LTKPNTNFPSVYDSKYHEVSIKKSSKVFKAGYIVRKEVVDGVELSVAYNFEGNYIGSSVDAYRLCKKRGIKPELASPNNKVCSRGFCEKESKYYGWSHRAIYGFGVGSTCEPGDCHYQPSDKEDFIKDMLRFWADPEYREVFAGEEYEDSSGNLGFDVIFEYNDKVPNKSLRGDIGSVFCHYPDSYGKGSWTAQTLKEAKQMAIGFAEGVS